MSQYLVTGGAGFIGCNMVRFLLEKGKSVRVLDNFETGKKSNLQPLLSDIELIEGDIRDVDCCRRSVKGIDKVIHLAAVGSVPRSVEDPVTTYDINATGLFNLLNAAKDGNVGRFVFSSSSSVYGQSDVLPQHESLPLAPISPYAASKATGELYCRAFYEAYGLETVPLRYYNIFGPWQDPQSQYAAAIPLFILAIMNDQSPQIFGDGQQSRGFTYIDNATNANWQAAHCEVANGEPINISTATAISVNKVVEIIKHKFDKTELVNNYFAKRSGDIKYSLADITRARERLGYNPAIDFETGIQKTITWYKQNLL